MIESFDASLFDKIRYQYAQLDESNSRSTLNLLPIHITDLKIEIQKQVNREKYIPTAITSSLKIIDGIFINELAKTSNGEISNKLSIFAIKKIFDEYKPFLFDLIELLNIIINPDQRTVDIMTAISIVGYYYCSDPRGILMIKQIDMISKFLGFLNNDELSQIFDPILYGIAGIIRFEDPEEENPVSYHLLSNHFNERLIYIYNNFCSETPILAVGNIVKSLIKSQNANQFLIPLLSFIPILNSFINSNKYEYVRISIQSARHLITKFPDARKELDESGYIENLKTLMSSENFVFGELRSVIHFLRFYCRSDQDRSQEMFTNQLNNLVFSLISKNGHDINGILKILYDIDCIMRNFKFLIYSVLDSELFTYIAQTAYDGPFVISLQCSIILCDIINSKNPEGVAKVIEANFLESLQQVLTCDDQDFIMLALDTIFDLFDMDRGQVDGQFVQSLKSQEWLPDTILDLCDQNENDEKVIGKARYIYDNIISSIFSSE